MICASLGCAEHSSSSAAAAWLSWCTGGELRASDTRKESSPGPRPPPGGVLCVCRESSRCFKAAAPRVAAPDAERLRCPQLLGCAGAGAGAGAGTGGCGGWQLLEPARPWSWRPLGCVQEVPEVCGRKSACLSAAQPRLHPAVSGTFAAPFAVIWGWCCARPPALPDAFCSSAAGLASQAREEGFTERFRVRFSPSGDRGGGQSLCPSPSPVCC